MWYPTVLSDKIFDSIVSKRKRSKNLRVAALGIGLAAVTAGAVHYYTVKPGDTLSSIAQTACGNANDWTGIYQQNTYTIGNNANLIIPGEHIKFACNATAITSALADPPAHTNSGMADIVVPTASNNSFQACVIARESGGNPQITNSSDHYGLYQFSASTWAEYGGNPADFGNASVAEQNQVFANAMATPGGASNWAPYDGC